MMTGLTSEGESATPSLAQPRDEVAGRPMRSWSPTVVGRVAGWLIAAQIAFRWHSVLRGFFFEDDFPNLYDATTSDLSFELLFRGVNGHLKPGGYLLIWVLQRLAPMNFGVVAIVLITLQIAASVVVWLLIRELLGRRPGALLPLAVYLFAPLTLGAYLWYAASIETVLLQLVLAGALLFHLRYLRTGRWQNAACSIGFVVAGLLNWEKALLAVPFVFCFHFLMRASGNPWRRAVSTIGGHWRLWAVHTVVVVGYVWLYLARVGFGLGGDGASSTPSLAREGILKGFVPAVTGGWLGSLPGDGTARAQSSAAYLLPAALFVTFVVATVVAHRSAWRAWMLLLLHLSFDLLLLAGSGRGAVLGVEVGRDVRFFADASVVMAVVLAMALYPAAADGSPLRPQRLGERLERPRLLVLVLALYVVNCMLTSFGIVDRWAATSAGPFVRTAQSDLRLLGDVVLIDGPPPEGVLAPWFLDDHRLSRVLVPLPERPRFDEPAETWYLVAPDGNLRPASFSAASTTPAGPDVGCGWRVDSDVPVELTFGQPMYDWDWVIQVGYYSGSEVSVAVTVDGDRTVVVLPAGLHDIHLAHLGTATTVTVELLEPGSTMCLGHVKVGQMTG